MFDFSTAIQELKGGKGVARSGWNGNKAPPIIEPAPSYEPKERVEYVADFDLTYIRLSDGKIAVCDGNKYDYVLKHKWTSDNGQYAFFTDNKNKKTVKLHNYLFGELRNGFVIDHINGDGLDCRSINMRVASFQENNSNRRNKIHSSQYKGVSWDSSRNKWIVSIQVNGVTKHIGRFDDEISAAKVYDKKAWKLFGQYAKLNFPNEVLPPRMFIYYVPANSYPPSTDIALNYFGGSVPYDAYIAMKTANDTVVPWLASQTDILAEDWYVVSDV